MSQILHPDLHREAAIRFTARTDDNHAAAVAVSNCLEVSSFNKRSLSCQAAVRSIASYRIKPHAPPIVQIPVNSFEF